VDEDGGRAFVERFEQRGEARVAEVVAFRVGRQRHPVQVELIERSLELRQTGRHVGQRKDRMGPEPIRMPTLEIGGVVVVDRQSAAARAGSTKLTCGDDTESTAAAIPTSFMTASARSAVHSGIGIPPSSVFRPASRSASR